MDILAQAETIDAAPFVGIIAQIIMWFGLIITLSIIKGWIVQGTAVAIGEWLMRTNSEESRERVVRWLGDKDQVLEYLRLILEKTGGTEK